MASYWGSDGSCIYFVNMKMEAWEYHSMHVGQRTTFSGQVSPAIMWNPEI